MCGRGKGRSRVRRAPGAGWCRFSEVARGGEEFVENAPSTVLDVWLKAMVEKRGAKNELKPANLYQGCIFAWNAHREGKTIQTIRFDAKKGLYTVHE